MTKVSHDELISQFVSVTNCSVDVASDILRGAKWDFNQAINFYFEKDAAPRLVSPTVIHEHIRAEGNRSPGKKQNEKNSKFNMLRKEALEKQRWMVIYLTEKEIQVSVLKNIGLRDLMNCRFLGLELNKEESDGLMFYNFYGVRKTPYLCVIDPETKERVDEMITDFRIEKIYSFLRQFLIDNPKHGLPIDIELDKFEQEIGFSSSQDDSCDDESEQNNEKDVEQKNEEEFGDKVTLMIQIPNGKRFKLEIGQDSKISLLYSKISALLKKDSSEFKLFKMPFTELSDKDKKLSEMNCKNCLIRVDEI